MGKVCYFILFYYINMKVKLILCKLIVNFLKFLVFPRNTSTPHKAYILGLFLSFAFFPFCPFSSVNVGQIADKIKLSEAAAYLTYLFPCRRKSRTFYSFSIYFVNIFSAVVGFLPLSRARVRAAMLTNVNFFNLSCQTGRLNNGSCYFFPFAVY